MINRHRTLVWWLGYIALLALWFVVLATGVLTGISTFIIFIIGGVLGWSYAHFMGKAGFHPVQRMGKR